MTPVVARQMFGAEILKLRRNRAVMGLAFVLSIGVVLLFFGYSAIEHASNPAMNGPAGGVDRFERAVRALALIFGALTAALIGTEAGTADLSSGVFRDLVATGRSRLSWSPPSSARRRCWKGSAIMSRRPRPTTMPRRRRRPSAR